MIFGRASSICDSTGTNETLTTVKGDVALITRHRRGKHPAQETHTTLEDRPRQTLPENTRRVASLGSRPEKRNRPRRSRIRNFMRLSLTLCCVASSEHQHGGGRPPCEPREYCKLAPPSRNISKSTQDDHTSRGSPAVDKPAKCRKKAQILHQVPP